MADEKTPTPKKTTRKPDPLARLMNDVKAEMKNLAGASVTPPSASRTDQYERRASAWGRHYAEHGTLDGLILSLGFEALAGLNPAERRHSLLQLAAAALVAVEKLDGEK